jgi:putative membrane protein
VLVQSRRTWLSEIFTYQGTVLPRIWRRLLFVAGLTFALTLGHVELRQFMVRDVTPLPFTLTGFALSVFLGFRTTTAYNRFWEGRTLWGGLVNVSRNFTRQVQTWLAPPPGTALDEPATAALTDLRRRLVHHTIAFNHALRQRLRDEDDLDEYEVMLDPELRASIVADVNRPLAITSHMAGLLRGAYDAGLIHPQHVPVLEASLGVMTDLQGGCERIRSTPLPYVYRVLVHQIVGFYCFSLPFGLIHTLQWFAPVVAVLVAYAFFGLDAIGEELDNPFETDANDLPLAAITRGIEIDLRARLGETDLPAAAVPHHGLLL